MKKSAGLNEGIIFFVIAVVLIAAGFFFRSDNQGTWAKTPAVIYAIESEYDIVQENTDYTVWVRYTVNGQEYLEELGTYFVGMKEGKELEVEYNVDKPEQVRYPGSPIVAYILIAAGVIMIFVGVKILLSQKEDQKKQLNPTEKDLF